MPLTITPHRGAPSFSVYISTSRALNETSNIEFTSTGIKNSNPVKVNYKITSCPVDETLQTGARSMSSLNQEKEVGRSFTFWTSANTAPVLTWIINRIQQSRSVQFPMQLKLSTVKSCRHCCPLYLLLTKETFTSHMKKEPQGSTSPGHATHFLRKLSIYLAATRDMAVTSPLYSIRLVSHRKRFTLRKPYSRPTFQMKTA